MRARTTSKIIIERLQCHHDALGIFPIFISANIDFLDRLLELVVRAIIVPMIDLRNSDHLGSILAHEVMDPANEERGIFRDMFDPVANMLTKRFRNAFPTGVRLKYTTPTTRCLEPCCISWRTQAAWSVLAMALLILIAPKKHHSTSSTFSWPVCATEFVGNNCICSFRMRFLQPGDVIELEVEGIGILKNRPVKH